MLIHVMGDTEVARMEELVGELLGQTISEASTRNPFDGASVCLGGVKGAVGERNRNVTGAGIGPLERKRNTFNGSMMLQTTKMTMMEEFQRDRGARELPAFGGPWPADNVRQRSTGKGEQRSVQGSALRR